MKTKMLLTNFVDNKNYKLKYLQYVFINQKRINAYVLNIILIYLS